MVLLLVLIFPAAFAQLPNNTEAFRQAVNNQGDSIQAIGALSSFSHFIALEYRPAWVIPSPAYTNQQDTYPFGRFEQSAHLKYGFALPKTSLGHQVFPNTQQGAGLAVYDFGNTAEIGTPIVAYLFQKSEIAKIARRLSLDYEWNFGLSTGWEAYDPDTNPNNLIVGSRVNAFISLGTSLSWKLTKNLALFSGFNFSHFSNGNTKYPNAGVNLLSGKLGVIYEVSDPDASPLATQTLQKPVFTRHISYDFVAYGSWRRKAVQFLEKEVHSPHQYTVVGAYFAPMFNWSYRWRTGLSIDALYDGSANVYIEDYIVGTEQQFFDPKLNQQIAFGLSARIDYVMPLFTINLGIGKHMLHKGDDMNGSYQALALKIKATKNVFLNIGYSVKDFQEPNYLMFGLGYRFNNKTPPLIAR